MEDYKWGYIQQTIINNLNRGKSENIYRKDMDSAVVAKVYLLSVDMSFWRPDIFGRAKKLHTNSLSKFFTCTCVAL